MPLAMQSVHAAASEILPAGRWRDAVRGFALSNSRSAMRLKAMAQVRAQTIDARISKNILQPGQPRLSRAATAIEAMAKGRAKTVCESLIKSNHLPRVAKGEDGIGMVCPVTLPPSTGA